MYRIVYTVECRMHIYFITLCIRSRNVFYLPDGKMDLDIAYLQICLLNMHGGHNYAYNMYILHTIYATYIS